MMNTYRVISYDIPAFKKHKGQIKLTELPNILQVMDYIAEEELQHKLDPLISSYISELECEGNFMMTRNNKSGLIQFMPVSPSGQIFFRGQSKYFDVCKPSIFRGLSPTQVLIERLKLSEFIYLLSYHPIVHDFILANIEVDYIGLAQHYGIKTDVLDLTNNKWIAAFFACTEYSNGSFNLLDSSFNFEMGIIYTLDVEIEDFENDISVIGAQPFERPTRQNAYSLKRRENQDFNDMKGLRIIPFRHDSNAEKVLYDIFYNSKRIFPEDLLVEVVKDLNEMTDISYPAVLFCKDTFYPNISDSKLSMQISKTGFTIVPEMKIKFPEEKLHDQCQYWWNFGREKLNRKIKQIMVSTIDLNSK